MNFEVQYIDELNEAQLSNLKYQRVKRVLDVSLAIFFLVLFGPLLILIALGIKLHSPGPVLYRQKRVGKNGVQYDMLKFRSMRVNNDQDIHKNHVQSLIKNNTSPKDLGSDSLKLAADPRITGLGKLLRKYGLDELPQFINVLRGEMSIVGPRPPLPYEYEIYSNWHKQRLKVLPGITGLWQVSAHNTVPFDEMVKIDLSYIKNMNLWMDLRIMVYTPIEMMRAKE